MDTSQLYIQLEVYTAEAQRRLEWLRALPPAVQRFIPFELAVWWVMRSVKVSAR